MTRHDLCQQLDDVIRTATSLRESVESGGEPCLADSRILQQQAACVDRLVEILHIAKLRATPVPPPEQDKAAQVAMAEKWSERC
jgi:L-lysine 2,3-aminomutase